MNGHRMGDESVLQEKEEPQSAHNWEDEKNKDKDFYDDGTMTFFWCVCMCFVVNNLPSYSLALVSSSFKEMADLEQFVAK